MNGTLLIAGGNIGATEQGKKEIFSRFAELCGGKSAKVVLAVCASGDPEDSFSANRELLLEAGVGQVALLPLTEQPDLVGRNSWTNRADQSLLPVLEGAGGIWFGGGDQLRTARLLLQADDTDTPVLAAMRRHAEQAGVEFLAGKVLNAVQMPDAWYVSVGPDMYNARAVVLAAGVARGKKFAGARRQT